MAHSQEQQDAGGSRAHPQGYLMRLHQLSREHDAAAVKAAAQDRSGHHQQLQQQQQQVAAAQQPAMQESVPRRAHTTPGGDAQHPATRLTTASLPGGQLDQPQRLQRVQEIVRQLEARRLQQQQEQRALQQQQQSQPPPQQQPQPPPQQQPQPPPESQLHPPRQHRRVMHVAGGATATVAAAAADASVPVALASAAAPHLLDVGRGWTDDSWEGVFKAAAPIYAPIDAAGQQQGTAGVGRPQQHDTGGGPEHEPLCSRFTLTALPDEGSTHGQQEQQAEVYVRQAHHAEGGYLQHRHSLPLQATALHWQQQQQQQLPRPAPARPAQGAARQLFPSQQGGAAASPPRLGVGVSFAPLRRSSGVDGVAHRLAAGSAEPSSDKQQQQGHRRPAAAPTGAAAAAAGPIYGGVADGASAGVCDPWQAQLQHLHHKLEARKQRQQPEMQQTHGELLQQVEQLWGALTEQEQQHRDALQQLLVQHQQQCAKLQQLHQVALEEQQAAHEEQLQAAQAGHAGELMQLGQQQEVMQRKLQLLQQELDRATVVAADNTQHLNERLSQALAEKSELQLHHLEMKQCLRRLQEDQERLLSANIDLTEQQQQHQLDQLRSYEQQRAHARELQEQQRRQQQALLHREAQLMACQQQLQDAKAALQGEVELQHAQIKAMLQKLQKQEQLMIADVRAVKASFAKDLKDEAQRHKELCQQHGKLEEKHREVATKLRRLQRDHARLLDRKLECDRRITSLQQQLQQRKQQASGSQAGGGGAKSSAAAPVARRPGLQQQIQLRGTAALGSRQAALLEAEQARAAAESKAAELELENQVLAEVLDAWQQSDSEGLLHSMVQHASLSGQPQQQQQQQLLDATLSPIKGVVQGTGAGAQAAAAAAARTAAAATILMDQQQQPRHGSVRALQPPPQRAAPSGPPAVGSSQGPIFKSGSRLAAAGPRQRIPGTSTCAANMAAAAAMAELSVMQEQLAACKAANARQTQAASAGTTTALMHSSTRFGRGSSSTLQQQQKPWAGHQQQHVQAVPSAVAVWDEGAAHALFGLASPKVLQPECSNQTLIGFNASIGSTTQEAAQWHARRRRRQAPLLASFDAQPGDLGVAVSRAFVSPPPSDSGADPHELPGLCKAVRGGSSVAASQAGLSMAAHQLGSDNGTEHWTDCMQSVSMTSSFVTAVGGESSSETLAAAASQTQPRRQPGQQAAAEAAATALKYRSMCDSLQAQLQALESSQAASAGAAVGGGPVAAAATPIATEQQVAASSEPATGHWLDAFQQQMMDVEVMFGELRSGLTSEAGCSPASAAPDADAAVPLEGAEQSEAGNDGRLPCVQFAVNMSGTSLYVP